MPQVLVISDDTYRSLKDEGVSLQELRSINRMTKVLSADDLADIELGIRYFPFSFDRELDVQLVPSPLKQLLDDEPLKDRVQQRVETLQLRYDTDFQMGDAVTIPVYSLDVVDETFWVVVWQRSRHEEGDPDNMQLSYNRAFFDAMIAQVLHTFSFERMSRTNLFSYYLKSLPLD